MSATEDRSLPLGIGPSAQGQIGTDRDRSISASVPAEIVENSTQNRAQGPIGTDISSYRSSLIDNRGTRHPSYTRAITANDEIRDIGPCQALELGGRS